MARGENKLTIERVAEPAPALACKELQVSIIRYCDNVDDNAAEWIQQV